MTPRNKFKAKQKSEGNPTLTAALGVAIALGTGLAIVATTALFRGTSETSLAPPTLEKRAQELSRSLSEAITLVSELEQEIQNRQFIAKELQEEIETNKQLAQFNAEEAEAVAKLVERKLSRSFWRDTGMGFMFFLMGSIVTVITGRLFSHRKKHSPPDDGDQEPQE